MLRKVIAFALLLSAGTGFFLVSWPLYIFASTWLRVWQNSDPYTFIGVPSLQALPAVVLEELRDRWWGTSLLAQGILFAVSAFFYFLAGKGRRRSIGVQTLRLTGLAALIFLFNALIFCLAIPGNGTGDYWFWIGEQLMYLLIMALPLMLFLALVIPLILPDRRPAGPGSRLPA